MTKRFWLGALAYVVPTFPLGYFWHLSTFATAYQKLEMYRNEVIIPMGLASMLIQAAIFSWAYPKLFSTARSQVWASAAKCFAAFGLLAWSFIVLPVAAKYRMASVADFMALETGFTLLQYAVVAPLIALAHRDPH